MFWNLTNKLTTVSNCRHNVRLTLMFFNTKHFTYITAVKGYHLKLVLTLPVFFLQPRNRSFLRKITSVQPKFISNHVYYHLELKTNLLRYVELWLCSCGFDTLNLHICVDRLSFSRSSSQQSWPIL